MSVSKELKAERAAGELKAERAAGYAEGVRAATPHKPVKLHTLDPRAADSFARPYGASRKPDAPIAADAKPARTARAVWPSAAVQSWYRQALQAITFNMRQEIVPAMRSAWRDTEPLLGGASDAPTRGQRAQTVLTKWADRWTLRLNSLSLDLADKFADKSFRATQAMMKASFKDAGLTVKFKPTPGSLEAYRMTSAENVALIKSIPEQYAKDVQVQVMQSVKRGADLATLTEQLKGSYGVAQRRAELIARDQNNKAKATIEDVRRQEMGIAEAIWMHSSAGKVPRPTHVAMNNKRYKIGKGMFDSAVDRYVLPGEEIECRCSSRAVLPGFE